MGHPQQEAARRLPNLIVAQRVLDKMAAAARAWHAEETGEALVGLVEPGVHTGGVPGICLLDTIAPDDSALRAAHSFQQGDDFQDEVLWWLQENWRRVRQASELPPNRDVPLRYLGDWHKQPGGMTRPSRGDLHTARAWLRDPDNGMGFLLAPIVTAQGPASGDAVNRVRIDGRTCVDFWYLHAQDRDFRAIPPSVWRDAQLPRLTALPWHLQQPGRLEQELERLQNLGHALSAFLFLDLLDNDALDVCFHLGRAGAAQHFLVATPPDYPASPPQLRLAPAATPPDEAQLHAHFTQQWRDAAPLPTPAHWQCLAERSLATLIDALERDPVLRAGTAAPTAAQGRLPRRDAP